MSVFGLRDTADLRDELTALGAGHAGSLAPSQLLAGLEDESTVAFDRAFEFEATAYELGADGQVVRSPWRLAIADAGPILRSVHQSPEAAKLVSEIAGVPLAPTKASYLYFRNDTDFIGFHTDVPACEVVLLVGVTDRSAELVLYPHLEHAEPSELLELSRGSGGAPEGGQSLPVERGGVVALVGRRVPHQTPRAIRSGRAVQASLCYAGQGRS